MPTPPDRQIFLSTVRGATNVPSDPEIALWIPLEQPWHEVKYEIDWQPRQDHEIPVFRIFTDVHKCAAMGRLDVKKDEQNNSVIPVSEEMDGMQPQYCPNYRSVGIRVPVAIQ